MAGSPATVLGMIQEARGILRNEVLEVGDLGLGVEVRLQSLELVGRACEGLQHARRELLVVDVEAVQAQRDGLPAADGRTPALRRFRVGRLLEDSPEHGQREPGADSCTEQGSARQRDPSRVEHAAVDLVVRLRVSHFRTFLVSSPHVGDDVSISA